MPEITIKGKGLIKKIDKTDPEYTGEGGVTKYIPLDGELVCVTDGDSAGLVVGDGTSTVDKCKSVGGGVEQKTFSFPDLGGETEGSVSELESYLGKPLSVFASISNFKADIPYRDSEDNDCSLTYVYACTPLAQASVMRSDTIDGVYYDITFTQSYMATTDDPNYEEDPTHELKLTVYIYINEGYNSAHIGIEASFGGNDITLGSDSGLQDIFTDGTCILTLYSK